ncbi:autophagy protein [Niveomyces insectorum RCEF 264]|uniref:Autophagy protein n=1 Tax=Niveomyces insectorum RCEF 264 TaxID=1081102 RepID=A0A167M2N2_9HYPO|nr:autophagy protein [Niveomyces insectorum RCEF 264]
MPSSLARSLNQDPAASGHTDHEHQHTTTDRDPRRTTTTTKNNHKDRDGKDDDDGEGSGGSNEHSPLLSPDPETAFGARTAAAMNVAADDAGDDDLERNRTAAGVAALSPGRHDHHHLHTDDDDDYHHHQRTKSVWYLVLLTISIGGLQIAWSVELSNGSPYLLSLGLSKSLMALVWIAGPLSGTLVQPYVGMLSDNCRVPWGKRKPFMLGGAAATIVSLLCLAWTKEMVAGPLTGLFGADPASEGVKVAVIVVAVLWVYILDFAINTVQAAIRAFIVDCAPAHQQEAANSMASRITGVGNIIGYVAGYVNLPRVLWWLGDTQFKDLCAIASIALGTTVALSCLVIRERDPRLEGPPPASAATKSGVLAFFRQIFVSIRRLPPQIKRVCEVQFCAWVGFFPMLFYTSSYIGEIYVEPFLEENPHMTPAELDRLYEQATRVGTFALLIYSITSLCTNVFLPFFIAPTYDSQPVTGPPPPPGGEHLPQQQQHAFLLDGARDGAGETKGEGKPWLDYLVIPGLTLRRAWMLSLLLFSGSMFCTVLVRSVAAATVLIGLVGITWALTLWAPWAIISAEISRRDAQIRSRKRARQLASAIAADGSGDATNSVDNNSVNDDDDDEEEEVDQAGVILGIHNMAIAAPQILATVGSSIVFKFLQKPRGTPGDHSIAVVMALGGVTVLLAAYFVHKIEDEPTALLLAAGRGAPADELTAAEGPYYAALYRGDIDADDAASNHSGGSIGSNHSGSGSGTSTPSSGDRLGRRMSSEQLSRASLERATLVRNSSFGAGLEY